MKPAHIQSEPQHEPVVAAPPKAQMVIVFTVSEITFVENLGQPKDAPVQLKFLRRMSFGLTVVPLSNISSNLPV